VCGVVALRATRHAKPAGVERAAVADTPVPGGTLVVAYAGDVDSLDPVVARGSATLDVLEHVFPPLVEAAFDGRLSFTPGLARAWEVDATGRELTLRLRKDFTWQDGEPVDVDDLLSTLERARDPALSSHRGVLLEALDEERPWERVDAHTVVIRFAEPTDEHAMLSVLGRNLVAPQHASGPEPLCAGPFVVEDWTRNDRLVLRAREGEALLDRVVVRVLSDPEARLREFELEQVDVLPGLDVDHVQRLAEARPDARIVRRGERFLEFVGWNLADERFADVRVRTALAQAVDVQVMLRALLTVGEETYGRQAVGTVPPLMCGAYAGGLEPLAYDPEAARAVLGEMGLEFELLYASGDARRERMGLILQQQLAEVGVEVVLRPLERSAVHQRLRQGEFEAALSGWAKGLVVDPRPFWQTGAPFNFVGYSRGEVDALIEEGLAAGEGSDAVWQRLQAEIYGDQPYLFLVWVDDLVAVDPRVRDVGTDEVGLLTGLERWWVPVGERRYE
jgi:peptide/nickel transport system substrate-binding protein